MQMISKRIAPLVAGALLFASTAATAQTAPAPASSLSVAAAMQSSGEETGFLGSSEVLIPIFVIVAFALVAVAFQDHDDDDDEAPAPTSP
jgi:hypothetical protein